MVNKSDNKRNTGFFVQRVVLAHGHVIDLICFDDVRAADSVIEEIMAELQRKKTELQTCPLCKSKLVYPVERYQINDMEWKVMLLCPNCLCKRELVVDRETVRELLKNARVGRETLMKELDGMQKRNMEEEAEKFITALHKDHILPIDF
ncbi:MAG: hypothetical protein M1340_06655 [Actinobacteria bacterium]|nr:hypothetical protein [Actinomycetota bacterium]MCL6093500.1 hypothetical protein [Actinomycetota bacterium]